MLILEPKHDVQRRRLGDGTTLELVPNLPLEKNQ